MSPTSAKSAIPDVYFWIFGIYEPMLTTLGFLGTVADPKSTHDAQAPWPGGIAPTEPLPRATLVTLLQLAHVCALLGVINFFILSTVRTELRSQPRLQEKIVWSLFTPLLIGDTAHLVVTLWALGEEKWDVKSYPPMLWTTLLLGLTLMIPRIAWHLGIGRYVDSRDGPITMKKESTRQH